MQFNITKRWSVRFVCSNDENDLLITPAIQLSLPPNDLIEIIKPSFGLMIVWGFSGWGLFFIKSRKYEKNNNRKSFSRNSFN